MNNLYSRILVLLGSILAITSFFLKWVQVTNSDLLKRGAELVSAGVTALLPEVGFIAVGLVKLLERPLIEITEISPYEILFQFSFLPQSMKLLAAIPLVLAILALIRLLLSVMDIDFNNMVDYVLIAISVVGLTTLFLSQRAIERLGFNAGIVVSAVVEALGLRISIGFWVAMAGIVLIIAGLAIGLKRDPELDSYSHEPMYTEEW